MPVVAKAELDAAAASPRPTWPACATSGWRLPSNLAVEVRRLLAAGEPFVYAYYDGIDKIAHEYGLGRVLRRRAAWPPTAWSAIVLAVLPAGAVLLVTADHGQVDVGDDRAARTRASLALTRLLSGEGRFRWLHARPGAGGRRCWRPPTEAHGDVAWVVPASR